VTLITHASEFFLLFLTVRESKAGRKARQGKARKLGRKRVCEANTCTPKRHVCDLGSEWRGFMHDTRFASFSR
jgi:hypothetical protein